MTVKCTFLFEMSTSPPTGQRARVAGWTESWYDTNNALNGVAIQTAALRYARMRTMLLPPTSECVGVRFGDVDDKSSRAFPFSMRGTSGLPTDIPQLSLLLRIQARNAPNHFSFFLRNVPDACVFGGEYQNTSSVSAGPFSSGIIAWWNLLANQYRFRGKDTSIPQFKIQTINASGTLELEEASSAIAVGDKVQIRRTHFDDTCCGGGGVYKVKQFVDPENFTISGWDGGNAHGGTVSLKSELVDYQIAFPESVQNLVVRATKREVGRPFDLWRGRRSPTCCR